MKFKVSSSIEVMDPEKGLYPLLDKLVLSNPDYFKKQQMGKWLGDTPEKICLYERIGDRLRRPCGNSNRRQPL